MNCKCNKLHRVEAHGHEVETFTAGFELIKKRLCLRLYRCDVCDTYWQIDYGDRSDLAIKVVEPELWDTFNDNPYRMEYFIRYHDGHGDKQCSYSGCEKPVLKNMAICENHAYPEFIEEGN